jgi:hypothetical protein
MKGWYMRDDALFDVEYGYWFNQINERFYRRLDVLLNLVQLVGGSAAALAAMQSAPQAVVIAGLSLAICAAMSLLVQPSVKSERHRACKVQWRELKGDAIHLSDEELHERVSDLQGSGPMGIEALSMPAYNATLCATGRESGVRILSMVQRIAITVA